MRDHLRRKKTQHLKPLCEVLGMMGPSLPVCVSALWYLGACVLSLS